MTKGARRLGAAALCAAATWALPVSASAESDGGGDVCFTAGGASKPAGKCAEVLAVGGDGEAVRRVRWDFARPFPTVIVRAADGKDPQSAGGALPPVRVVLARKDPLDGRGRYALGAPQKVSGNTAGNYAPRWSPDGRYVAYHQIGDTPRLVIWDTSTGKGAPVEFSKGGGGGDDLYGDSAARVASFDWHPVEVRLYVKLKDTAGLQQVDVRDGTPRVSAASGLPPAAQVAFSPDGRRIAWRQEGRETGLSVRDLAEGRDLRVCGDEEFCRDVRWSPEGDELVFWRTKKDGERFQVVLARIPDDGGAPQTMVVSDGVDPAAGDGGRKRRKDAGLAAAFSPDGTNIAWFEGGSIRVVATADAWASPGAGDRAIALQVEADTDKSDFVWLDANNIVYVRHRQQSFPITLVDLASKRSRELASAFELNYDLAVSPDRKKLAFSAFDRQQAIMVADLTREIPAALRERAGDGELSVKFSGEAQKAEWGKRTSRPLGKRLTLSVVARPRPDRQGADVEVSVSAGAAGVPGKPTGGGGKAPDGARPGGESGKPPVEEKLHDDFE